MGRVQAARLASTPLPPASASWEQTRIPEEGSKPDVSSWLISRVLLSPPSWSMPLTTTAPRKVTFLCVVGSNAPSGISVRHWPLGISL